MIYSTSSKVQSIAVSSQPWIQPVMPTFPVSFADHSGVHLGFVFFEEVANHGGGALFAAFLNAAAFAADCHRAQRRKDASKSPYVSHCVAIARLLAVEGSINDVEVLAAALLHDTIEGTRSTKEEICCRFGKRVASIVMELTDDKSLPKHRREELQVEYAPLLSIDAALVKVADKIYNLRDLIHCRPEGWLRQQIAENFEWAKEVVNSLPPFPSVLRSTFAAAYGSASKS